MDTQELAVKLAMQAWEIHIKRTTDLINTLSDEKLMNAIASGKNRGIYLLGHLIAVHDAMNGILGLGERSHVDLDEMFLRNPDSLDAAMPPLAQLRMYWNDSNVILSTRFKNLSAADWFARHTQMSDEDFTKEPHRNKLAVLINRTNHLAYHLGQLILLK